MIRQVHLLRRNLVLVREHEASEPGEESGDRRIDIWWRGKAHNIGLMLTVAHQLTRSGSWKNARVVLKRLIQDESEREEMEEHLHAFVGEQRLKMEVEIMGLEGRNAFDVIHASSGDADLVMCGLKPPAPEEDEASYQEYCRRILSATDGLPVAFVLSSEDIDFSQIIGMG